MEIFKHTKVRKMHSYGKIRNLKDFEVSKIKNIRYLKLNIIFKLERLETVHSLKIYDLLLKKSRLKFLC